MKHLLKKFILVKKPIVLILLLIIVLSSSIAQNTKSILQGIIVDASNGERVPYSSIQVKNSTNGTMSNVDGHFTIYLKPSDGDQILVSCLGYSTKEFTIDKSGKVMEINLEPISQDIEEVYVSAHDKSKTLQLPLNKVSTVRMNPRLITSLPNMGEVDIFKALQLLPGISGTQETSSGLIIRGGSPDQNLILFDGMHVYHVDHFYGVYSAFNVNAIKDVQVLKGGYESKYGGRVSGVIDIVGKEGSFKEVNGNVGVNLLSTNASLEFPVIKDKLSLLVAGRRSYTDVMRTGVYKKLYKNMTEKDNADDYDDFGMGEGFMEEGVKMPKYHFYDFNSRLTFKPSKKQTFTLSYYSGKDFLDNSVKNDNNDFGMGMDGGSESSDSSYKYSEDIKDETKWGNRAVSCRWSKQWGKKLYSNLISSYSNYFSDYINRTQTQYTEGNKTHKDTYGTTQLNNVKDYSTSLNFEWHTLPDIKFDFGVDYKYNDISYQLTMDDTIKWQDRKEQGQLISGYIQNRFTGVKNLLINTGVRVVKNNEYSQLFFEPRLSVSYKLTSKLTIKSATGIYNQFINRVVLEDLFSGSRDFWLLSNQKDIPKVSSEHFIVGSSYDTRHFRFDIEAYHKNMHGLLEYSLRYGFDDAGDEKQNNSNNSDLDANFYTGKGFVNGIDVLVQKKSGAHTGWISYTLQEVVHEFPGLNQGKKFYAKHDQRHEVKIVNIYSVKKWDFSCTWVYATGKPYTAPIGSYQLELLGGKKERAILVSKKNELRLPAYHRLDASITRNFNYNNVRGQIGFSIFNLYNQKNIKDRRFIKRDFDPKTWKSYDVPRFYPKDVLLLGMLPSLSFNLVF